MEFKLLFRTLVFFLFLNSINSQQKFSKRAISKIKIEAEKLVEKDYKKTQVMVDKVYSFSELGFQEKEINNFYDENIIGNKYAEE